MNNSMEFIWEEAFFLKFRAVCAVLSLDFYWLPKKYRGGEQPFPFVEGSMMHSYFQTAWFNCNWGSMTHMMVENFLTEQELLNVLNFSFDDYYLPTDIDYQTGQEVQLQALAAAGIVLKPVPDA